MKRQWKIINGLRRFSIFAITVSIILLSFGSAIANQDENIVISTLSEDSVIDYAQNFANYFDSSLNLEAGNLVPIYDDNNMAVGYSVSYYSDDVPYGYIINPAIKYANYAA